MEETPGTSSATSFFEAVAAGDLRAVERHLDRDPSILNTRDEEGRSGLLLAVYHGHLELVNLLAERQPSTDIFEAAASGRIDRVQDLVRDEPGRVYHFSPDGFTPLGLAAFFGHPEVVGVLLEAGAEPDVRSRNAMKVTPLHSAAASGDLEVAVEIARELLERGADPDAVQAGGWRPLHQAASHGNVDLVRLLLDHGSDPHAASDDGRTPLALAGEGEHSEVVSLLESATVR